MGNINIFSWQIKKTLIYDLQNVDREPLTVKKNHFFMKYKITVVTTK